MGRRGKAEGAGWRELSKGAEMFSILIRVEVTKFMNLHLKFVHLIICKLYLNLKKKMAAVGSEGVKGLACHFQGCLLLQRPHEYL